MDPFFASSISVLLAKGRSQCVIISVNYVEEETTDKWDQRFQYYSKLHNVLQYYLILNKNLHRVITVQDTFQLFLW